MYLGYYSAYTATQTQTVYAELKLGPGIFFILRCGVSCLPAKDHKVMIIWCYRNTVIVVFSRSYCCTLYDQLLASYCCLFVCLFVTLCIVAKRYILQQVSEQVNRKCPLGTQFYNFQPLHRPYLSISVPPILRNFTNSLYHAFLVT